jgi:hypothetical protein
MISRPRMWDAPRQGREKRANVHGCCEPADPAWPSCAPPGRAPGSGDRLASWFRWFSLAKPRFTTGLFISCLQHVAAGDVGPLRRATSVAFSHASRAQPSPVMVRPQGSGGSRSPPPACLPRSSSSALMNATSSPNTDPPRFPGKVDGLFECLMNPSPTSLFTGSRHARRITQTPVEAPPFPPVSAFPSRLVRPRGLRI